MSSGFVVTCIERGCRQGLEEARKFMDMALFHLEQERENAGERGGREALGEKEREKEKFGEELKEEAAQAKTKFHLLGNRRQSDVLFIKNVSEFSEIAIYNKIVANVARAKYVRRIIPIRSFFTVNRELLAKNAEELGRGLEHSFKIVLEKRLCSHFERDAVIQTVAEQISAPVDLKSPAYVLVIEISKDLCGMALLKNCPGNFNVLRGPIQQ